MRKPLGAVAAVALLLPLVAVSAARADDVPCPSNFPNNCVVSPTPDGDPYQGNVSQVPGGPWTSTIAQDSPTPVQMGLFPGYGLDAAVQADDVDPWDTSKLADNCKWEAEQDFAKGLVPDGLRILGPVITIDWMKVRTITEIDYKWCWRQVSSTTRHNWYIPRWISLRFVSDENTANGELRRFRCGQAGIGGFDHFRINGNMWDGAVTTINPDPFNVPCVRGSTSNSVAKPINPNHKRLIYAGDFPEWTAKITTVNNSMPDETFAFNHGFINPSA